MSGTATLFSIHRLVWVALMAALMAVGSMISIPLGPLSPVPVTLQNLFVLLAGLILGPRDGAVAVLLFITAGCLGLPVFAGGKAGLAVLIGPTGGFLASYVFTAMLTGMAHGLPLKPKAVMLSLCCLGTAFTLILGSVTLSVVLGISLPKALAAGALPFIPGDLVKCVAAVGAYRFLATRRLVPVC